MSGEHKPGAGERIIAGLRDAAAGNFARVTIDGQTWVRETPETAAERDSLRAEVERLKASAPNPKVEDALSNLEQAIVNQYKTENIALRAEVEQLTELLRSTGANRYWEGR